ncbi:MAG: hypothetical protein HW390_2732 [Candidatus Brocadiaceae bacterium]|nr:hypothetical protein [Candidatus Brocadiaceae bacterium]
MVKQFCCECPCVLPLSVVTFNIINSYKMQCFYLKQSLLLEGLVWNVTNENKVDYEKNYCNSTR